MGAVIRSIITSIAFAIFFAIGSASAGSLTTTFASNNGQAGNMFDVDVLARPMSLSFLGLNLRAGNHTLNVYYKTGTWVGFQTNAGAWTLHATQAVTSTGTGSATIANIPDLALNANTTYAFYVTITSSNMRYTNGSATGAIYASNGDLQIREGAGKSFLFGSTFQPRVWNGIFGYEIYDATITKDVDVSTTSTANELLTYTIEVENTGDTNLTGVSISDQLAQGGSSITLTPVGPTTDIGTVGALDPGETWEFIATHNVTAAEFANGADLVNTATLNATQLSTDFASDFATTTLIQDASLDFVKTAQLNKAVGNSGTDAEVGDTITYTYEVLNDGNLVLSNIDVADIHSGSGPFPDPNSETLTDNAPLGDSDDSVSGANGIWDALAPGDVVQFSASYTVTQTDIDNQ